jgi:hypothetical protein
MMSDVPTRIAYHKTADHRSTASLQRRFAKALLLPFAILATLCLMFTDHYPHFEDE